MVTSGSRSGGFPTHPGNTWNAWNSSALPGFYFSGKPLFRHGAVQGDILLRQIAVCPSRPGASTPAPEAVEMRCSSTGTPTGFAGLSLPYSERFPSFGPGAEDHGQASLCRTHQTPQHVCSPALSGRLVPTTPRGPPIHRRSDGRRPALTSG